MWNVRNGVLAIARRARIGKSGALCVPFKAERAIEFHNAFSASNAQQGKIPQLNHLLGYSMPPIRSAGTAYDFNPHHRLQTLQTIVF